LAESKNPFNRINIKYSNTTLLTVVVLTIFIIPLLRVSPRLNLLSIAITIIIIIAAASIEKYKNKILLAAIITIITEWIADILGLRFLLLISIALNIIFFLFIVFSFIRQVASAKKVSSTVILESINGYLMLGLAYAMVVAFIMLIDSNAFNFTGIDTLDIYKHSSFGNYIYYSFITLTTVGYGDVVPVIPIAKSFSIFIALSGQFYLTIIMATLISKYINQR